MKYFLWATTEKKPVMRFFDHWFEVVDFYNLMDWEIGNPIFPVEVYERIDVTKRKDDASSYSDGYTLGS